MTQPAEGTRVAPAPSSTPVFRARDDDAAARTEAAWLDDHFDGCEPEYRTLLEAAGIRAGDVVLDLGCGNGRFFAWETELASRNGTVIALDGSPAMVRLTAAAAGRSGSALAFAAADACWLPLAPGSVDVAWCANLFEYLDAEHQVACLSGLARVVKPGGIIAVKDSDWAHKLFHPTPLPFWQRFLLAAAERLPDFFVGRGIAGSFRRAGLTPTVRTVLTERTPPLSEAEQRWICRSAAATVDDARRWLGQEWQAEIDSFARSFQPGDPDYVLEHPDFYYCEGNTLITASTPLSPGDATMTPRQG